MQNKIPRVIHYCWFGEKKLPDDVKKCIQTWKKICPGYEIRRWDESNTPIEKIPFARDAYEAKAWAFVSDFVRLKVVYEYGGIYFDTDVELIKDVEWLLKYSCFLARQQSGEINTGLGFGAQKESSVIRKMLQEYEKVTFKQKCLQELACPILNTRAIECYGFINTGKVQVQDDVIVLSPEYMDPYSSGKKVENLLCEKTISIHHYSASWTTGLQRIKRKTARIIGEDKIIQIKKIIC